MLANNGHWVHNIYWALGRLEYGDWSPSIVLMTKMDQIVDVERETNVDDYIAVATS